MKNNNWILNSILITIIVLLIVLLFFQKLNNYKREIHFKLNPLEDIGMTPETNLCKYSFWIIGDSRAAQWDTSFLNYTSLDIWNSGIGGQSSKQVLERFENDLEISQPDYLLLQVGINDLKCIGLLKDKDITENCINNIIRILDICMEKDIFVIYSSIFPVGKIETLRKPFWSNNINDSLRKVNSVIKKYCIRNNISFFDSYSILLDSTRPNMIKKEYQNDFMHLNKKGYVYLSRRLHDSIEIPIGN